MGRRQHPCLSLWSRGCAGGFKRAERSDWEVRVVSEMKRARWPDLDAVPDVASDDSVGLGQRILMG